MIASLGRLAGTALAPAIRLAIAALVGAILMHWVDSSRYGAQIADLKRRAAESMAELERLRAEAQSRAREIERQYAAAAQAAAMELANARVEIESKSEELRRAVRDRDILRDGLRHALAAYASGGASGDTIAACQARAGALAQAVADGANLLAEGAGLLEQAALAHDARAAEVRAMLQAWPGAAQ